MSYARRRDENQDELKAVFYQFDCSVLDIASTPCGFDLVIGYKTQAILVEVKDGAKPESKRKLTENEARAHLNWKGPKAIVENIDHAIAVAKLLRNRHFAIMESEWSDLSAV